MNDASAHKGAAPAEAPKDLSVEEPGDVTVLKRVAEAGGALDPLANPLAKNGYEFPSLGPDQSRLPSLAQRDYLDKRFVDRVSLCPRCASHHLNIRETCPTCRKPNLANEMLLHHFRCGYVGREHEFESQGGDRVCPKCNKPLRHLGVEFDRLGKTFRCNDCGLSFQDPPVDALCLSCGAHGAAEDLPNVDIFGYVLNSRGLAAIENGGEIEARADSPTFEGGGVYRQSVMRAMLEQEAKQSAFFNREICVLTIDVAELRATASEQAILGLIDALRRRLRVVDIVGRLSPSRFAAMLPETSAQDAERLREALSAALGPDSPLALQVTVVRTPQDLAAAFAAEAPAP